MTPGRWELVRGMAYPTMALVIGGRREQVVKLHPRIGLIVHVSGEPGGRPARPGEVPEKVERALRTEEARRGAA